MAESAHQATARRALTRERILDAALELADREGFDALTMRRLADELGTGAMSLYRHVRDREDLIDGITEVVASTVELPATDDWRVYIAEAARSVYRMGQDHPRTFAPLVARPGTLQTPHLAALVSGLLERLVRADLDDRQAVLAARTLVNFLTGAVLSDVVGRVDLPGGALEPMEEFEAGLDIVLRGIAAQLPD